ncbi:MAG: sugar ABC transporter substrate-binding protein [Burkholderiales bacterium]
MRVKTKKTLVCLVNLIAVIAVAACSNQNQLPDGASAKTVKVSSSYLGSDIVEDSSSYLSSDLAADSERILDPSEYQFAIIYGGAHPFFDPWKPGALAAAKDLGIPEPYIMSPQAWDQPEQNSVIVNVVAKGAKGIGMFPSDAEASNTEITYLVRSGIPVVTMGGSPKEPSDAEFCFATDVGASVALGTQKLIDKLKENGLSEGSIVHLCSALNDTNTQKRQSAIKEVLSKPENAGFTLYRELADTDNTELAEEAISEMYSSYIDEVDGIICTGYVNAQVLAKTMMVKNESRVVAVGIDDSQDVLDAIDQGYMYGTMTQNPWGMGYVAVYALKLLKDGYTFREDQPFFINSGYFLLTKENLDSYQETMEENTKSFVSTMKDKYFIKPIK